MGKHFGIQRTGRNMNLIEAFGLFLLGGYVMGAIGTFSVTLFCCMLGGDNRDLWKPFAYCTIWPLVVARFLLVRDF